MLTEGSAYAAGKNTKLNAKIIGTTVFLTLIFFFASVAQ